MNKLTIDAPAKINLSLDILEKLPNGYHKVLMIMQAIPLFDKVTVEVCDGNGIAIFCDMAEVPTDERNSAHKAARLFMERTELNGKIKITIDKKIPAAAGMAGGSSDAAAVLKGLNEIFNKPLTTDEILSLCLKIGADVPFCYMGGCAISEGIGEILTPMEALKDAFLVIAKPDFEVSTKWVYENFKFENVIKHPNTNAVIDSIKNGDIKGVAENTANVLESVTESEYPIISEYKTLMYEEGAVLSMMSGSGPTVFGIFNDESKGKKAYSELKKLTSDAFLLKI